MSVLYVGADAWSFSYGALVQSSSSVCDFTRVIGLNVSVQTSDIRLSRASSRAARSSEDANVYGGAISMKIGAYARSEIGSGDSDATCEATVCDNCSVSLSHVIVAGSSAVSEAAGGSSRGAFVYGGSVAVVFGAQLWSSSSFRGLSRVIVKESNVSGLQLTLSHCSITGSVAATSIIGGQLSSASSAGSEALGGGVAVVVGSFVFSSVGPFGDLKTSVSGSYVRSSGILLAQNRFSDCTVTSSNEGADSGSLGSSSVYGGALAVIQSPQMSIFNNGLLSPKRHRIQWLRLHGLRL